MGNVKWSILAFYLILLIQITHAALFQLGGTAPNEYVLHEGYVFDWYNFRFETGDFKLTSTSPSYTQDTTITLLNPRQTIPFPNRKTGNADSHSMKTSLAILRDGNLTFTHSFAGSNVIVVVNQSGSSFLVMGSGQANCPGSNGDAFCVYDRGGSLKFSWAIPNGASRYYNHSEYGGNSWSIVCPLTPLTNNQKNNVQYCGAFEPSIQVRAGDTVYFGGSTTPGNREMSGLRLNAYGICDGYKESGFDFDISENVCTLCPLPSGASASREWSTTLATAGAAACCGDDFNDCSRVSNGQLCSQDSSGVFSWQSAPQKIGNVVSTSACGVANSLLSNGTNWLDCKNNWFTPTNPATVVKSSGSAQSVCLPLSVEPTLSPVGVYSCCTGGGCGAVTTSLDLGEWVRPNPGTAITVPNIGQTPNSNAFPPNYLSLYNLSFGSGFYYRAGLTIPHYEYLFCTDDGTFAANLDSEKATCQAAGQNNLNIAWTGTKCCGDYLYSSYNDPKPQNPDSNPGACYLGQPVFQTQGPIQNGKIKSIGGRLFACDPSAVTDPLTGQPFKDESGANLVQMSNTCAVDTTTNYYCDIDGVWKRPAQATTSLSLSSAPASWNAATPTACCGANSCWDGTTCLPDQTANPLSPAPRGDGLRCIAGIWTPSYPKSKPHVRPLTANPLTTQSQNPISGYCPRSNQCFVSENGNPADNDNTAPGKNPQCITSGQWTRDNYCEGGTWTSRTQKLAQTMLATVGSEDFTLSCGPASKTLNYYGDGVGRNLQILQNIFIAGFNHACVLQRGSTVMIGLAFQDYNYAKSTLPDFLPDFSACVPGTGLTPCGSSQKAWIDTNLNIALYSTSPTVYSVVTTNPDTVFIAPHANTALSYLRNQAPQFTYTFTTDGLTLDWLYVHRKQGKIAFATIDQGTFIGLYNPIDPAKAQFCSAISAYAKTAGTLASNYQDIACLRDSTNMYIIATGYQSAGIDPYRFWPDATMRLRP